MLSIFESDLLTDFLGNQFNDFLPEYEPMHIGSYFNPPSVAIMNAVRTPQLDFSENYSSQDYINNNERAKYGFGEFDSVHTDKFKIEDE